MAACRDGADMRVANGLLGQEVGCDVANIVASIAVCRPFRRVGFDAAHTRLHREREIVDLGAGIVVVELARDHKALQFQQGSKRVAERRLTTVPHMQGACRVGRDEFDQNRLALAASAFAKARAGGQDAVRGMLFGARIHAQVDESSAGDFCAGQPF